MNWLAIPLKKPIYICRDIFPLTEVILHGVTAETMLYDVSELHGRSNSKLCILDV